MGDAIKAFGTAARDAQVALVYYSGHGMQAKEENYLIPVGAQIETEGDLELDAVPLKALMRQIDDARPRTAVVVLDACRDNPVASRTKSGTKGLSRVHNPPGNALIVFAAQAGATATDNGVFAKELANRIVEPNVGIRAVFDKVGQAVSRSTNQRQTIQRYDQLSEDLVLLATARAEPVPEQRPVPSGPTVLTAEQIEQQAWEAASRSNAEAGYRAYLSEYPQGRFAAAARVAVAGLSAVNAVRVQPAVSAPALQPQVSAPTPAPIQQTVQAGQSIKDCDICPELVIIPSGSFTMGSSEDDDERPPHQVNIQGFAMGKFEVTQGQWRMVLGSNPSRFKDCGDNCPVESVSWNDIQEYIQKLNQKSGKTYRLATEAEWEYAARAGSTGQWSFGDSDIQLGEYGWYRANSGSKTQRVGQKRPNAFGLYDMHGNVWEWVQDCWHKNYSGAPSDGSSWTTNCTDNARVLRGGSWYATPAFLRSADRNWGTPDDRGIGIGFRLARPVP
jgi:formylglycine-generating enzyme required for sulfatase activity